MPFVDAVGAEFAAPQPILIDSQRSLAADRQPMCSIGQSTGVTSLNVWTCPQQARMVTRMQEEIPASRDVQNSKRSEVSRRESKLSISKSGYRQALPSK